MNKKIILPETLWRRILERIQNDFMERAFYLVGTEFQDKILIYEAFEFSYISRSLYHIESDPIGRLFLSDSLPIGLKIVGILHSHPFERGDANLSSIDLTLAKNYWGEAIISVSSDGVCRAIRFNAGHIEDLSVESKDLDDEVPVVLSIENIYAIFPKAISRMEITLYIPRLYAEFMYKIYIKSKYDEKTGSLKPPKYEWIFLKREYTIPHIIFSEQQREYLLRKLV